MKSKVSPLLSHLVTENILLILFSRFIVQPVLLVHSRIMLKLRQAASAPQYHLKIHYDNSCIYLPSHHPPYILHP